MATVQPLNVNALMTSTNYTIYADDFNSGLVMTSTNYRLENTTGESPAGYTSGTTYIVYGGYQAMDRSSLSLSISDSSLDLGNLSASSVSEDSTTVTVSADDSSGYTLAISSVAWSGTGTALNNTTGNVTAGSNEYGFAISGTDVDSSLLVTDNIVEAKTLMSSSTSVTGVTSTLTFKASISSGTSAGTRSNSVVLSLSNNL